MASGSRATFASAAAGHFFKNYGIKEGCVRELQLQIVCFGVEAWVKESETRKHV